LLQKYLAGLVNLLYMEFTKRSVKILLTD
jgi:hypothetical protein